VLSYNSPCVVRGCRAEKSRRWKRLCANRNRSGTMIAELSYSFLPPKELPSFRYSLADFWDWTNCGRRWVVQTLYRLRPCSAFCA